MHRRPEAIQFCGEMSRWLRLAAQGTVVGLRADRPVIPQAGRKEGKNASDQSRTSSILLRSMCRVGSHRGSQEVMLIRADSVNNEF